MLEETLKVLYFERNRTLFHVRVIDETIAELLLLDAGERLQKVAT